MPRSRGFWQRFRDWFQGTPELPEEPVEPRVPPGTLGSILNREEPEPEPEPEPDETNEGLPLSNHLYHVILAGYGVVWFRPIIGEDYQARDYTINMQGFLRDGSKNHPRRWYERNIQNMRDITVNGELSDGTRIFDTEFETDLGTIEYYANSQPLTGAGWRSD